MPTGRDRARIQQGCSIQVYFLRYAFALIGKGGATALAKTAPYPGRGAETTWGALGEGEDAPRHGNPRGQRRRRRAPAALAVAVQGPIRRAFILEGDRATQASALDGFQAPRPPCCDGSCDVAARPIPWQCQRVQPCISLSPPLVQAYRHRDARAMVAATGATLFLVVEPSGQESPSSRVPLREPADRLAQTILVSEVLLLAGVCGRAV